MTRIRPATDRGAVRDPLAAADRGYGRVARADAPPAVRESVEFAAVCPDDATATARRLD